MIGALIEFEPNLVIIPFPDSKDLIKECPFMHEPSILASTGSCKRYHVEDIYLADSMPTTTKIFGGHDSIAVIFNSRELAQIADEQDGIIRVCYVQASKVIAAGYFQGSTKTLNKVHWTKHLNALPRLNKVDVEIQIRNIDDLTGDGNKYGSKNKCFAAHVLCAKKDEPKVVAALCNQYGKDRKSTNASANMIEGRPMKFVTCNAKGLITKSPDELRQLAKNRILHSWNQKKHHPVSMWGFTDIYIVLTAPYGHEFSICQVISTTKCSFDYITPLFVGVDVTPEGEVFFICSIDMKKRG